MLRRTVTAFDANGTKRRGKWPHGAAAEGAGPSHGILEAFWPCEGSNFDSDTRNTVLPVMDAAVNAGGAPAKTPFVRFFISREKQH